MQTTVDNPRYWLVWREGGNAPTYRHPDQASAEAEAKRLAHAFPGDTFAVLCPYARVTVSNLIIERRRHSILRFRWLTTRRSNGRTPR